MNYGRRSQRAGSKNVRSLLAAATAGVTACSVHLALESVEAAALEGAPKTLAPMGEPSPVVTTRIASAGGGTLWGVTSDGVGAAAAYTIDTTTGAATFVTSIGNRTSSDVGAAFLGDVLYASDMLWFDGRETVSVDLPDGTPTVISDQGGSKAWAAMASNEATGVLYTLDAGDGVNVLQTLDPNGTITAIGTGTGITAVGLAFDNTNDVLYAAAIREQGSSDMLYTIDVQTGTSQLVGDLGFAIPAARAGLAFDDETGTLYLNSRNRLYTVNTGTGAATLVGPNNVDPSIPVDGLAWQPGPGDPDPCIACPCPEDSTGDGLVGFDEILDILSNWGPCPDNASGPLLSPLFGLASGNPGKLYSLDPATGAATFIVDLNGIASFTGLAWLNEVLYGSNLFDYPGESQTVDTGSIDTTDGTITLVSGQDYGVEWHGLAANDSAGLLYSVDLDRQTLYSVAPDGTTTSIAPTIIEARGLAYRDAGGILYATHSNNQLYTIDVTTGDETLIGPLNVNLNSRPGLAYDESLGILYLNISGGGNGDTLYTVDTVTGAATPVGPNNATGIDGLAWVPGFSPCDSCPCAADINRDDLVGFADILEVLGAWGPCE